MSRGFKGLICWLMALAVPVAMNAGVTGAMVYGYGTVTINGAKVLRPQAVFAGDKVQTAGSSSVTVAGTGWSALMAGESSLGLLAKGISVDAGTASVTAQPGMVVQAGPASLKPVEKDSKFQIAHEPQGVKVVAQAGRISILYGPAEPTVLGPGESFVIPARYMAVQGQAPAATTSNGGLSTAKSVAIALTTAVASTVAVVLGTKDSPESPTTP